MILRSHRGIEWEYFYFSYGGVKCNGMFSQNVDEFNKIGDLQYW
jgi:hypothetical protein